MTDIEARIAAVLEQETRGWFEVDYTLIATPGQQAKLYGEHLAPLVRRISEELVCHVDSGEWLYGYISKRAWDRTLSAVEGEGR